MFAVIPTSQLHMVSVEDVGKWYENLRQSFSHDDAEEYICTSLNATKLIPANSRVQAMVVANNLDKKGLIKR